MEGARQIEDRVFYELRRVYRRYVAGRMRDEAKRMGMTPRRYRGPRGGDGLTVFIPDAVAMASRLQEWAEVEAARKASVAASTAYGR